MNIIIDIDGTVCEEKPTFERALAKPLCGAVDSVNSLYDAGNTIIFYSSRSWAEYNLTKDWLDTNGFKYHQLVLGKPGGEVWIDDRALQFTTWDDIMSKLNKPKDIDKIKELEERLSTIRLKEIDRLIQLDPDPESEDGKYLNELATEQEIYEKKGINSNDLV
jgi:predicted mannosyl-3-phosphoglycerate phosphatase (HAD superfamily)